MVRPIVIEGGGKVFYGTREAIYDFSLKTKKDMEKFSEGLISTMETINKSFSDPMRGLYLQQHPIMGRIKLEKDELVSRLGNPENIFLHAYASKELIVNFISSFVPKKDKHRNRIMEIKGFGVPNDFIEFDPTLLYELGEKYGNLRMGVDFDISLSNYREI